MLVVVDKRSQWRIAANEVDDDARRRQRSTHWWRSFRCLYHEDRVEFAALDPAQPLDAFQLDGSIVVAGLHDAVDRRSAFVNILRCPVPPMIRVSSCSFPRVSFACPDIEKKQQTRLGALHQPVFLTLLFDAPQRIALHGCVL